MFKFVAIVALAAVALADDAPYAQPAYKQAAYKEPAYDTPAKYNFNWAVKDDYTYNNYGQTESRDGYNTDGSYFVQLPDGRLQTVKYYVNGDSGYVAEVTYSGEPKYEASYNKPVYAPAPAAYKAEPAYKPAPAAYKPEPAYKPAPAYAPAAYKPAPAPYKPAYKPAPAPYRAAPAYKAPAAYPAPAPYKA